MHKESEDAFVYIYILFYATAKEVHRESDACRCAYECNTVADTTFQTQQLGFKAIPFVFAERASRRRPFHMPLRCQVSNNARIIASECHSSANTRRSLKCHNVIDRVRDTNRDVRSLYFNRFSRRRVTAGALRWAALKGFGELAAAS